MRPDLKTTSDSDLESVFSVEEPRTSTKPSQKYKYICEYPGCGLDFKRQTYLDRHEFKHTGVKKHICFYDGCDKAYTIITHLKRHIKVSHETTEKKRDVKCRFDFCDKLFSSLYNMERHIREVHENPKIYECLHCHQKFPQKIKLRRHEVKHTGKYPFNCSKCSKGFVQEYYFERHVCKSYKCEDCKMTFEKWSELMAHRKSENHTKTMLTCEKCGKTFKRKFNLSEHLNSHEEDKEVYTCPREGCTKFYIHKKSLMNHIQIVHENRKFPCVIEGCNAVLTTKKTLRNHVKNKHRKTEEAAKPKPVSKPRNKRKDAGKRKRSTLTKLSGVIVDRKIEKMLVDGKVDIHIDPKVIEAEDEEADASPGESDTEFQKLVVLELEKL